MKKYPTITVFVVIAVHVALCWQFCQKPASGLLAQLIAFGISFGELGLPAVLLGLAYRIPTLVRVLILLLCVEAVSRQFDNGIYFLVMAFAAQVAALAWAWYWCTGWYLAPDDGEPIEPFPRGKFSLRQMLMTTTAIAIALAATRIRLNEIGVLGRIEWHEWFVLTNVAISSLLVICGVFASWQTAIKAFGATIVMCIIVAIVIRNTYSGGWLFVILTAGSFLNSVLPAIALRLCGWQWVRRRSKASLFDSAERGEIS